MNFNNLMAKMRELDGPVGESTIAECGEGIPGAEAAPTTPPSMSVNLNAQGVDSISSLMQLLTKVNPDMLWQKGPETVPGIGDAPSIMSIKPEESPLKMLPAIAGEPDHLEPDADNMGGPSDNDADNAIELDLDLDDVDDGEKKEAFGNSAPRSSGPEYKGLDAAIRDGNDLNKPKQMFKHSYRQGDNPMSMSEGDLRAHIRADLQQRLAEVKGVK